jgi:soluble cytochrome b562
MGLAVGITACAEKEPAAPEEPVEEQAAAAEEAAAPEQAEAAPAETEAWRDSAFLDHMHAHAEQLDDLNFALDDGDLEAAKTPAYWLSRHKAVSGLPDELQPFLVRMREAASMAEAAEDLDAAKAAAKEISNACQDCHAATGVVDQ